MKSKNMLKISILSLSFLMMLRLTISSALAVIGEVVNKSATEMQVMVIVASLLAIPFGFLSGVLAGRFKTKSVLYVGLILYIIGGMGPMLMPNFGYMIVCRALLGTGTGLMIPYSASLIADFFKGEEFKMMIGLQSAAVAIGNIITSVLAGVLASINWRLSFLIYGFAIITFILVAVFIPEPEKSAAEQKEKHKMNGKMWFICAAILIYAVCYFAFFGFISYVVAAMGGNAAQAGLASMAMTLASMIAGILYSNVLRGLKRAMLPVVLILNVIGFFTISQAPAFGMLVIGAAVVGLGFGLLMPFGTMRIIEAGPKSGASFANGVYMTSVNLGTAISPAILALIGTVSGHKDDGQFIWLVASVVLAVGTVISIILALTVKAPQSAAE